MRVVSTLMVVGAFGGLLYLGQLLVQHGIPTAQAQTAPCGPGLACKVKKLTVTGSGASSFTGAVYQPDLRVGVSSLWIGFQKSGSTLYSAGTGLGLGDVPIYVASSTLKAASGSNAISFVTDGARLDLGTGSNDYLISNNGYPSSAGGLKLNINSVAKPTCDDTARGVVWFSPGGAGVADALEVCKKDAAGSFAWAALF